MLNLLAKAVVCNVRCEARYIAKYRALHLIVRPFLRNRVYVEIMMLLRVWRFSTLLRTALALTMESAHVLELPQKMQYDAQFYSAVNTTMYRYFALVGGVFQVGSIVAAFVLVFGIWLAVVAPVNSEVAEAMR
jgi:hypothetical protein